MNQYESLADKLTAMKKQYDLELYIEGEISKFAESLASKVDTFLQQQNKKKEVKKEHCSSSRVYGRPVNVSKCKYTQVGTTTPKPSLPTINTNEIKTNCRDGIWVEYTMVKNKEKAKQERGVFAPWYKGYWKKTIPKPSADDRIPSFIHYQRPDTRRSVRIPTGRTSDNERIASFIHFTTTDPILQNEEEDYVRWDEDDEVDYQPRK